MAGEGGLWLLDQRQGGRMGRSSLGGCEQHCGLKVYSEEYVGAEKQEPCSMSRSDERKHSSRRICKLWTKVKSLQKQDNARRVKTPGISYESTPKKTKCQFQHVH